MAPSPDILKVAIAGASGRMGHMLIEAVRKTRPASWLVLWMCPQALALATMPLAFWAKPAA